MITIRPTRDADAEAVGRLIADTYSAFNLTFLPPEERGPFLGPFRHARSPDRSHQEAIARVTRTAMVFVADDDGEVEEDCRFSRCERSSSDHAAQATCGG